MCTVAYVFSEFIVFTGLIVNVNYFLRWNFGACSLSMAIGWTDPMGGEGEDVLIR